MRIKLKTLTVSLLSLGLSTFVFAKPVLQQSYNKIEEYKLDNGLKVILFENDKENKVFMNMIYQTGSLNDPKGKGGMAHLLEHLAFKGTQNIKGDSFQTRLDQYTLSNNASTDYYVTQYTNEVKSENKAIDEIIHLEAERMDKLVLQKKYVPTEIEIVKRERELTLDQPYSLLIDQVFEGIYGKQDLGRSPIGDLAELESINMDELNRFYKSWYAPNNAVMVITGKFDKAAVLKSLDARFGAIPARQLPEQATVPKIDLTKIKDKKISIQKGQNYQKVNLYLTPRNQKIEPVLTMAPLLLTMEPSGQLYQKIVDVGIADAAALSPWTSSDLNLMMTIVDYSSSQNTKKIDKALISGVEDFENFTEKDLNRIKTIFKNSVEADYKNALGMGELLSESVALNKENWTQYFKDKEAIQHLTIEDVNQDLRTYFKPENRINAEIAPTSEADKKAMKQHADTTSNALVEDDVEKPVPLKNVTEYTKESMGYKNSLVSSLKNAEAKIQRGSFDNGLQYALYSAPTSDDQTYANIVVNFGTSETMMNQKEIIDLTSYLLLRGSDKYTLQDIADKSIEMDGSVSINPRRNSLELSISADKEHFADYLKFVLEVIKTPLFEKSQFNQIKTKSLNRLDRSYTEPETVASLGLNKLVNQYPESDLRGSATPKFSQKLVKKASNDQVKQFYSRYFNMGNAQVSVAGEIDAKQIKAILESNLANWNGQERYEVIDAVYNPVQAQKHHLLAEQREFGHYKANLAIAVGAENKDMAAISVLSYILGESQLLSSRLGQELREKNNLVYGFTQYLGVSDYQDTGYMEITANYTAGKSEMVSQAVQKVFQDLLKKGVTEQEVEAAKAGILKLGATSFENTMSVNELLTPLLKHNRNLSYVTKTYEDVAKVTKADVDAAIQKYIKPNQLVEVMADQYGTK